MSAQNIQDEIAKKTKELEKEEEKLNKSLQAKKEGKRIIGKAIKQNADILAKSPAKCELLRAELKALNDQNAPKESTSRAPKGIISRAPKGITRSSTKKSGTSSLPAPEPASGSSGDIRDTEDSGQTRGRSSGPAARIPPIKNPQLKVSMPMALQDNIVKKRRTEGAYDLVGKWIEGQFGTT